MGAFEQAGVQSSNRVECSSLKPRRDLIEIHGVVSSPLNSHFVAILLADAVANAYLLVRIFRFSSMEESV
ncbi:MAG: hypothetical protein WCA22_14460 [Candidatus Binatus sp.]